MGAARDRATHLDLSEAIESVLTSPPLAEIFESQASCPPGVEELHGEAALVAIQLIPEVHTQIAELLRVDDSIIPGVVSEQTPVRGMRFSPIDGSGRYLLNRSRLVNVDVLGAGEELLAAELGIMRVPEDEGWVLKFAFF